MWTCINVVSSYCNKRVASVESMIEAPNPSGLTKLRHFWFDPKQPVFLWWMCPLLYTVVVRGAGWSCSFCVGVCVYVCVLCKANLLVVCRNKHVYPPVLFHLLLSLHISSLAPLYRLWEQHRSRMRCKDCSCALLYYCNNKKKCLCKSP